MFISIRANGAMNESSSHSPRPIVRGDVMSESSFLTDSSVEAAVRITCSDMISSHIIAHDTALPEGCTPVKKSFMGLMSNCGRMYGATLTVHDSMPRNRFVPSFLPVSYRNISTSHCGVSMPDMVKQASANTLA